MDKTNSKDVGPKEGTGAEIWNAGHDQTGDETGHSWGGNKPPISGPGIRTVPLKGKSLDTPMEGSNRSFLSKLNKNHLLGIAGIVAGSALLFRGAKGAWPFPKKANGAITLQTKQTINRPREVLYAYWRDLGNLPKFMSHLTEIWEIDEKRSQWTARIPGGVGTIDWEAIIEQEIENEYIAWRSIGDADIQNSGEVRFTDAANGKGTIVETTISYAPPAGNIGDYVAKLFNPTFETTIKKDLNDFKEHMEEGGEEKQKSEPAGKILY